MDVLSGDKATCAAMPVVKGASFTASRSFRHSAPTSPFARRKASWVKADCVIDAPVSSRNTPGTLRTGMPTP